MKKKSYTATKDDEYQRLDHVFQKLFTGLGIRPRRRLCEQGLVFVNGKKALASYKVRENDCIELRENTYSLEEGAQGLSLIHENNAFAAVTKKAHMHSIRVLGKESVNVEDLLPKIFKEKTPLLLNRLDYATSGLLMVAFSEEAKEQWEYFQERHETRKFYLALVEGRLSVKNGATLRINHKIILKKTQKVRIDRVQSGDRVTLVSLIAEAYCDELDNFVSLVLCEIKKGARHQIRAHLASADHPLVGDMKYGAKAHLSMDTLHTIIAENFGNSEKNIQKIVLHDDEECFLLHHIKIDFPSFEAISYPQYWDTLKPVIQERIFDHLK